MNYADALRIAEIWRADLEPFCEPGFDVIVGSLRRHKLDVHDIELMVKPILKPPVAQFGSLRTFLTPLDKFLFQMEEKGVIRKIKAGPKYKQYALTLDHYGLHSLNDFNLDLFLITAPAQLGVGMVIRTGPNSVSDKFSKWCGTNQSFGGCLPDGYKVKHLAVWNMDQIDGKGEPLKGSAPAFEMPEEIDFMRFLGLDWIEPQYRHAPNHGGG